MVQNELSSCLVFSGDSLFWEHVYLGSASCSVSASGLHRDRDERCVPPYLVRELIERLVTNGLGRRDARRFEKMRMDGNKFLKRNHLGESDVTSVGGWVQQRLYFRGRQMLTERCVGDFMEVPVVCSYD